MGSERAVFVDGDGLLRRGFHTIPTNLRTSAGHPTHVTFGFARMFRKVLASRRPAFGAVVFSPEPARDLADASRLQLPDVMRMVAAHNFRVLQPPDEDPADVIATWCTRARDAGADVWVVSGDPSTAQLVDERVRWYDPVQELLFDADRIGRRFGVAPSNFEDWVALVGDPQRGIQGVPGIGTTVATELLSEHRTLAALLEAAAQGQAGSVSTRLLQHAERANQSRAAAIRDRTRPLLGRLDDLRMAFPTPQQLDAIYLELEFFNLVSPAAATRPEGITYFVVDSVEMAHAAISNECQGHEPVALHVLIELPDALRGDLVGVAISPALGRGLYFPFAGPGQHLGEAGLPAMKDWLEDATRPKVLHDSKSARVALQRAGVTLRGVIGDTALASYLIDPTKHLPHRLSAVVREYLHVGLQRVQTVIGTARDRRLFGEIPVDRAGAWSCHNADAVGAAWRTLTSRVATEGQTHNLDSVDLPLAKVLAKMELTGIRMDPQVLRDAGDRLKAERKALRAAIAEHAGRRFNPGSHKQLGTVLFEELGLPVRKRTKTGYAVDAEVLHSLREAHPIVAEVLRWRTVDKLVHTYTDVLLGAIAPDGRIHPTYQTTVSASGRIITTEPDLQRTPVRTPEFRKLREAFVASEGHVLISADWSQVELRLLAHHSHDAALVEAFTRGEDVHKLTAAALFDVATDEVTAEQREVGKTVNFATIYGQGPPALARQLSVSTRVAKEHIRRFFDRYAGVARWRDTVVTEAHTDGYVTTQLGRRRYLPELWSGTPSDRAHAERAAINTPIQGSGADLCKVAMVKLADRLDAEGLAAQIVLTIHDELLLDVPVAEAQIVRALVHEVMSTALPLSVPLVVDIGMGRTWSEAHP